jgi:hypothetical protein
LKEAEKITGRGSRLRLQNNLIYKAPHPVFTRFDGLHDRVLGGVEMFSCVSVFGRIATTHVSTLPAQPQVNPSIAHLQALFAAIGMRLHLLNVAGV